MTDMLNKQPMSTDWLKSAYAELSQSVSPRVLLQGYPFTTFGRLESSGEISRPPGFREPIDWDRFWDVRIFAHSREWHAWQVDARLWSSRDSQDHADVKRCIKDRAYVLWGTSPGPSAEAPDWTCMTETRGTRVWVPFSVAQKKQLKLDTKIVLDEDPTGLMGVVDAWICGIQGDDWK